MPMPGASGGAGTLASGDLSDEYLARISYSAFGIVCEDHEAVAFARFVIAQDRQQRAADTRIAELEQALKGAAIIADTAGAEIRALRERIAALSATRTLKPVAWENPSTFAILREESPDMCDRRRKVWRPLAYAGPLDAHRGRIANRAGLVSRVLEPENDWGLMSDTPLQVEFGAYKSKTKAFTCSYEYRPDEDITEAVTCWMPLPVGPVIKREQDSPEGGQS
jgi:hypothetical protein